MYDDGSASSVCVRVCVGGLCEAGAAHGFRGIPMFVRVRV